MRRDADSPVSYMPSVFFSYARTDAPLVDKIAGDLARQGVGVWMDRQSLMAGQEWLPQIEQAIASADFMLVFLSKASVSSKWVQREYQAAFANQAKAGGTRLIPVLLEAVDLPPFLASIHYVDFSQSYFDGMQALLRVLKAPSGPTLQEVVEVPDLAKQVAGEVARILGLESGILNKREPSFDPKLVFVITSFLDDMEPIFEGVRDACTAVGLTAQRVKDVPGDYRITDRIVQMIQAARFIVADLTHERPNVYFELGYARGLGKTVITTARQGTNIHFDVKDWTYIPYIDSRILQRDLKSRLEYELSTSRAGSV